MTKIAITLDEVALIYRRAEGGALCFDIGQFRIRTLRRRHALDQEFTLKSDEIRLYAANPESKMPTYDPAPGPQPWKVSIRPKTLQVVLSLMACVFSWLDRSILCNSQDTEFTR